MGSYGVENKGMRKRRGGNGRLYRITFYVLHHLCSLLKICCSNTVIIEWFVQPDSSKLNTSTSDTGVLANFFNSLLSKKSAGAAVGPDGKPAGKHSTTMCSVLCVVSLS